MLRKETHFVSYHTIVYYQKVNDEISAYVFDRVNYITPHWW